MRGIGVFKTVTVTATLLFSVASFAQMQGMKNLGKATGNSMNKTAESMPAGGGSPAKTGAAGGAPSTKKYAKRPYQKPSPKVSRKKYTKPSNYTKPSKQG